MIIREITGALRTGLAASLARPRHLLLTVSGFLIASLTLVALLAIPAGLDQVAARTGLADVALVLPGSTSDESGGTIAPDLSRLASVLPGVALDRQGRPLVAPQFVVNAKLRRIDGTTSTVLVRGVTPVFWHVVGSSAHLSAGKRFGSGLNELIAGRGVARAFVGLDTGAKLSLNQTPWRVTGEFMAGGGLWESELWTDLGTLQAAYNAQGQITALWVKLSSPAAYRRYAAALHADSRLRSLQVLPQRDYYAARTAFLAKFVRIAAIVIASVLGLGAALAIVNALGMALTARRREINVLRAFGFRTFSVALALLIEVLVIGQCCAALALLLGRLLLNGHGVDSSTGSQAIRFSMDITPAVAGWVLAYIAVLGTLSALWPIWHVVRSPLLRGLRDE
ncbi:MAG: ABC transporter permease [Rhodanobacter sp.]|nr:MAG: ABC transporter permease [Rhodanobacter sp.]